MPLLGPGTDPFTSSRLRSGSTRTTSRFCTVTRVVAHVAGHLHALADAARRRARADRSRRAQAVRLTVRLRTAAESVPLDATLETAPFDVPVTSTSSPSAKRSALIPDRPRSSSDVVGFDFAQRVAT